MVPTFELQKHNAWFISFLHCKHCAVVWLLIVRMNSHYASIISSLQIKREFRGNETAFLVFKLLLDYLAPRCLMNVALVSHALWDISKDMISERCTFCVKVPQLIRLYIPHKISGVQVLFPSDLPITHLSFGDHFNLPLKDLPSTLTHLSFGMEFNCPIDWILPLNITYLTFSSNCFYNQPVDHLPPKLTHLTFGLHFNCTVTSLPQSITHLTFGHDFNQYVTQLPKSLTHLTFGYAFRKPVFHYLPHNLTYLTFGDQFRSDVDSLPSHLTYLSFGRCFDRPVDSLPETLTHLSFGEEFNQPINILPQNLTYLTFGNHFNQRVVAFPTTLTHLTFGNHFNQSIVSLPQSLTHLTFPDHYRHKIPVMPKIAYLNAGYGFKRINNQSFMLPITPDVVSLLFVSLVLSMFYFLTK